MILNRVIVIQHSDAVEDSQGQKNITYTRISTSVNKISLNPILFLFYKINMKQMQTKYYGNKQKY